MKGSISKRAKIDLYFDMIQLLLYFVCACVYQIWLFGITC